MDESLNQHSTDDDLVALREAISEIAAGDEGMSFEEFDKQFREKHKLPAR